MINLRSPYFVIKQAANLESANIKIYVHTGTQGSTVGGSQYDLSSTAITPSSGNPYVVFDIAELARDYIDTNFDGSYDCDAVWVNYQLSYTITGSGFSTDPVVQLTGFDGYRYFSEGEQGSASTYTAPDLLQSNTIVYKNDDDVVRIPVLQDNVYDAIFMCNGKITNYTRITTTTNSSDIIRYLTNTVASYDTFSKRVVADGGILEEDALGNVFRKYSTQPCDMVLLSDFSGDEIVKLEVRDISECKHKPYKLVFINKFGAKQDLWFFGKSSSSISTTKEEYKSNILTIGSYDTTNHQKKILSKNGSESLSLNSGWCPEEYNEVFRQLHLSELVWIDYEGEILPVNVSDGGMEFKKSVNDKLINNSITVEFAFDKINNIR